MNYRALNYSKTAAAVLLAAVLLSLSPVAHAFDSGSTGADGVFNPQVNTDVQLPAGGIFNYTTIDIPAGVTVTFTKNTLNTPVYWLATGDVNIAGTVDLNGAPGENYNDPVPIMGGAGGAGGFDGGRAADTTEQPVPGPGFGPGGGEICTASGAYGGGGGAYVSYGQVIDSACPEYPDSGQPYGNHLLSPLIGGSGGAGGRKMHNASGGGGGGGAILIASSTKITIGGSILANGGDGGNSGNAGEGGGGSGGAILLKTAEVAGDGLIEARGGQAVGNGTSYMHGGDGSDGRIRLEADIFSRQAVPAPPGTRWLPTAVFPLNLPTVTMTAINNTAIAAGTYGTPDYPEVSLDLNTDNPATIDITATDIPVGTTIQVLVTPMEGAQTVTASTPLSGTLASSTATATVTLPTSDTFFVVVATASFDPSQSASLNFPKYVEGEKIKLVVVSSKMGAGSNVFYITESGKKVPARM